MKTMLCFWRMLLLLSALCSPLDAQVVHPWHVIDNGGGPSAGGGLALQASVGQNATQSGTAPGFSLEGGYIPGARTISGTTSTLEFQAGVGWNMVSVPLIVGDFHKSALYPGAVSNAFGYAGSYVAQQVLQNGMGYWVQFPPGQSASFSGTSFARETLAVSQGWNMIGGISYPVLRTDAVPVNTALGSRFFGYTSSTGYFPADTLVPGRGYWINVSQAGKLVITSGSLIQVPGATGASVVERPIVSSGGSPPPQKQPAVVDRLTFRDASGRERVLNFTIPGKPIDMTEYELPPAAPEGVLDIRFNSNRSLEIADPKVAREIPVLVSSAVYPVSISWVDLYQPASLAIDGKSLGMEGSGGIQLAGPSSVKLVLPPAQPQEIPKEFSLSQNYPNPFNPVTRFQFSIAAVQFTTLKVYDVLGQEVATLVDEVKQPGVYTVEWDASARGSGVYYYRLQAGSFTESRRLVLVK